MTVPELAPRPTFAGIVAVWVVALVAGVAIAVFVPFEVRAVWFALALAGSLILAFAIQLVYGRSVGFIERVGASILGALLVLGLVSAAVGLAAIIPE
ncbi:MAG: hypothetical protein DI573_08445 [Microbacterium sp.]|jgi:hypothetical protein|uniref:hypothetical protein n=1 Tax=unclassified Microbacterium TaxID=2609290 RepID=UPI000DB31666|nr:hypothetical protein [Microbacterium sp.]PZU38958.1 MAG: hypothetical protein DI573_08445 [Microbacterium sp.]